MKRLVPVLLLAGLVFLPLARADDDSSSPALTGEDYLSECSDDTDADEAKSFLGAFYQNAGQAAAAAPLLKDALKLCEQNSVGRILAQHAAAPAPARKHKG